jgi:AAA domain
MAGRPTAIRTLADTPSQGHFNWLVFADSGAGKTVLAGTAPRGLFITCEAGGTESAKMFGSTADEWYCEDIRDFRKATEYLMKGGAKNYDWVMPDSISEIEELVWADLLKEKSRGETPAIQDYPAVWNRVKKIVDTYNRLPVNVLYTAQAFRLGTEDEDSDGNTLLLPLIGSTKRGDLAQKICGKVSLVGYLQVRERDTEDEDDEENTEEFRRLWIAKTDRMFAKSRHHRNTKYIDDPNIAEMAADVSKAIENRDKAKKKKGKAA